jgi:hypothetical protein
MTPRRAADRGTAATLAGSESLGEVATQPCTPWVGPGATIGRFLAAGDRVLAPARQLLSRRSSALALLEVVGAALGDPGTAAAWQTARPGPGWRPRWSAPRCLACSTLGLPVTSSRTTFRPSTLAAPAAHHLATSPRGPIDQDAAVEPHKQLGQLRRDTVIDVLALLPSRCSASRGWVLVRAASTSRPPLGRQQCRVWLRSSGSTRHSTSSGWYPALCHRHHHRVLARPCGCGRRLLWPVFGGAATRPGTLLQGLSTSKCWLYACGQGHVDFVRIFGG